MSDKIILSMDEVQMMAENLSRIMSQSMSPRHTGAIKVYPIPRGGIPVAFLIGQHLNIELVDDPLHADFIVDDLIDSGDTMARALAMSLRGDQVQQAVLVNKKELPADHPYQGWIVFPWEGDAVGSFEDTIKRLLQFVGEDAERGGLLETPKRVAKAWQSWTSGYGQDPGDVLKVFEDGAEGANEMVMVRDIPFYSHCEHHMAPFFGTATIAYIPDGKIVGLSKLSRVLDIFAKRLQVQERLTTQVADALVEHLAPKGVGVIINARHMCMESRGVCKQGHSTTTSALRGVMLEGAPRAEFLSLSR